MRGFYGIGVEGISKAANLGALLRTAHAFGASFAFTLAASYARGEGRAADTSDAPASLPLYEFADLESLALPQGCVLVGIELTPDAIELPSFHHPRQAAYVLGSERGTLTPAVQARCRHVVKIPTRFALNLALAGALVMYDRMVSLGRFAPRPVRAGGPAAPLPAPVFGPPAFRRRKVRPGIS